MTVDILDFVHTSPPFSTCCGAPSLGDVHDMQGICSACRDHASFEDVEEDEEPAPTPEATSLITDLGNFLYTAILEEHDAHEEGDAAKQNYSRGYIDGLETALKLAKAHLGIKEDTL